MNRRIAIIGAGPAGLSAALWLKNLGMTPIVLEKEAEAGGMLNVNFLPNDWVLGLPNMTGVDVARNFSQHIDANDIDVRFSQTLTKIKPCGHGYCLEIDSEEPLVCDAMIVASGTRYIGSEILSGYDGFSSLDSSKIFYGPHAFSHLERCCESHVVIIGAGDNAFENTLLLLEKGCRVTMISRSTAKAQSRFVEQAMSSNNFLLYENSIINNIEQNDEQLQLCVLSGGCDVEIKAERLHVLAGYQANIDPIGRLITTGVGQTLDSNEEGFLLVDAYGRTNINNIYAAGDICNIQFPCVVSAVASGALAAKTMSDDLS